MRRHIIEVAGYALREEGVWYGASVYRLDSHRIEITRQRMKTAFELEMDAVLFGLRDERVNDRWPVTIYGSEDLVRVGRKNLERPEEKWFWAYLTDIMEKKKVRLYWKTDRSRWHAAYMARVAIESEFIREE